MRAFAVFCVLCARFESVYQLKTGLTVPHFLAHPLPSSPSNKAGWAFTVNCSGIIVYNIHLYVIFLRLLLPPPPRPIIIYDNIIGMKNMVQCSHHILLLSDFDCLFCARVIELTGGVYLSTEGRDFDQLLLDWVLYKKR